MGRSRGLPVQNKPNAQRPVTRRVRVTRDHSFTLWQAVASVSKLVSNLLTYLRTRKRAEAKAFAGPPLRKPGAAAPPRL